MAVVRGIIGGVVRFINSEIDECKTPQLDESLTLDELLNTLPPSPAVVEARSMTADRRSLQAGAGGWNAHLGGQLN